MENTNLPRRLGGLLAAVRSKSPLIHQITNAVTIQDCANITLAIGASPIMADDLAEVADIAGIASALVLNIGTLNERTIASMLAAGRRANEIGIPVILDPVGAGASGLRSQTARILLDQVRLAVLRGNLSEISCIAGLGASTRGVDVSADDAGRDGRSIALQLARKLGCAVAITGPTDVLSDGCRVLQIRNGHRMLADITGTGCMSTALIGAFAAVSGDGLLAAAAGIAVMGIAGEIAYANAGQLGTASFRIALIDAASRMLPADLEALVKIDEA